ncbi:hypothetical protein T484DRAFT_1786416, partial [Baffinella frigidus]
PTGIEFTAELRDFIEQDLPKFYPDLLQFVRIRVLEASDRDLPKFYPDLLQFVRIRVLEASDRVLMQFRESMQA